MRARLVVLMSLVAGCTSSAPREASVPWPDTRTSQEASTARIVYAPEVSATPLFALDLADGAALVTCERGQRWLVRGGSTEVSSRLLPEDAVQAALTPSGRVRFLGRTGAIYEAATPLGPVERVTLPLDGAVKQVLAGGRIATVTASGQLFVSEDGAAFAERRLGRSAADVAMFADGFGLVLAYPERVFRTDDGGDTFRPLEGAAIGAQQLLSFRGGRAAVVGQRTTLVLEKGAPPSIRSEPPAPQPIEFQTRRPAMLDAADVVAGKTLVLGGSVFAATRVGRAKPHSLSRAGVGEPAVDEPLRGSDGCSELALTGDREALVGACVVDTRNGPEVKLLRWEKASEPPTELEGALRARRGEVRVHAEGGRLWVSGACYQGQRVCDPAGIFRLDRWVDRPSVEAAPEEPPAPVRVPFAQKPREDVKKGPWVLVRPPELGAMPDAMAVTGEAVFVVGPRQKGGRRALFVSRDRGATWTTTPIELASATAAPRALLSPLPEGGVAIAFDGPNASIHLADRDGRILSSSAPPIATGRTMVGLAGRRALFVQGDQVVETDDGGGTYVPSRPIDGLARDTTAVACLATGCFLGKSFARVGWGADRTRPPTPERALAGGGKRPAPPALAGLSCTLGREAWMKLPEGARLPNASDAGLGKPPWAMLIERPQTASAAMLRGTSKGTVEETPLLAPIAKPKGTAFAARPQAEGGIAVRARFDERPDPKRGDVAVRDLELAWSDLVGDKEGRARLADVARLPPHMLPNILPGVSMLGVDVLSIVPGGALFRLEPAPEGGVPRPKLLLFEDKQQKPSEVALPERGTGPTQDFLAVDGRPVAFSHAAGLLTWTSERSNGFFALSAESGPGAATLVTTRFDRKPMLAFVGVPVDGADGGLGAFGLVFSKLGVVDVVDLPTQARHAAGKRRACTADDRAKTPRVLAPPEPGGRRKIEVRSPDGADLATLVSLRRALHGTADDPCALVEDAEPPDPTAQRAAALVFAADLEHAWFFREGKSGIETRTMKCREDARVRLDE